MDTQLPIVAPEADPAAHAFARLAEKVDLLEAAIAGLAARREAMPDYSETLGEMADLLDKIRSTIKTLAARPAMTLTPDAMAEQIAAAAVKARTEDSATIGQARERIDKAANRIEYLAGQTATARDQRRRIWQAIGGGALAGCLLCSFLPGAILRAMPKGWHMPESMAAHIVGEPTLWEAGTRLMQADSPRAWDALTQAAEMLKDSQEAIEKCKRAATTARKPARCSIEVRPGS